MGNSLQEQLLKAGLVDGQRAKKAKAEKRRAAKRKQKGQTTAVDQDRLRAEQALKKKAERDHELNRQRAEELKRREIASQVRQMIETHRVRDSEGEVAFNFVDGNKLKRLFVTEDAQRRLSRGQLAIARLGDRYRLVPREIAEKISVRDVAAVIFCDQASSADEQDDLYRDYQVPDDLMW